MKSLFKRQSVFGFLKEADVYTLRKNTGNNRTTDSSSMNWRMEASYQYIIKEEY